MDNKDSGLTLFTEDLIALKKKRKTQRLREEMICSKRIEVFGSNRNIQNMDSRNNSLVKMGYARCIVRNLLEESLL
jgi:hypothetical protein